jgi:phosphoribosylanthranilate isomerase
MSLFIKLCGIRTEPELEVAVEAGADAVGFVLTESARQISLSQAAFLMSLVPKHILGVAVFHDPSPDLLHRTRAEVSPDLFQAEVRSLDAIPVDLALPVVVDGVDLESTVIEALRSTTREMVLVDSSAKGGTGRSPDWDRLSGLPSRDRVVLAGGLNHENVGEAVTRVRPFGVDVSSGIERRPGVKDPDLMRAFVTAARAAAVCRPTLPGVSVASTSTGTGDHITLDCTGGLDLGQTDAGGPELPHRGSLRSRESADVDQEVS